MPAFLLVCVVCVWVVCAVRAGRVCVLQSRRELTVWAAARFRVLVAHSLRGEGQDRCSTARWLGLCWRRKGSRASHHVVVSLCGVLRTTLFNLERVVVVLDGGYQPCARCLSTHMSSVANKQLHSCLGLQTFSV